MNTIRRLTYFLSAFVLGAGALLAFFHHLGLFEVKGVPVEFVFNDENAQGRGMTPAEAQLKDRIEASVKPLNGKRIWEIDLDDVRTTLVRDEWVKDILISRALPNELRVRVSPKNAVLLLVNKKGEFVPVTDDAELLNPLPLSVIPDVPLLRGEIFGSDLDRRKAAVEFVGELDTQGVLSRRNVSEIAWTNEDGFVLTLIHPKVEVKLGESKVDLKVLRVAQVLNYLSANNLKGRVIDASFSKKVLVRLRKGP